jgi:hypothetical protein
MVDSATVLPPGWRALDANGDPFTDAVLSFFDAGTSDALEVFSDSDLATSLGTSVDCNSGGEPVTSGNVPTLIYTGTDPYKVTISSAIAGFTRTFDNVKGALDTSSFLTSAAVADQSVVNISANRSITTADKGKLINMNCSGGTLTATFDDAATLGDGFFVGIRHAGTANTITITGDGTDTFAIPAGNETSFSLLGRGHGVWITCDGVNFKVHSEMLPLESKIRPEPQGYLTLVSNTPVIVSDQTSVSTVYYTPDKGNLIPIGDDVREFSQLSLALVSQHSASTIYDLFVFDDDGTLRLGTGPAWSNSGAGAGARSAALSRYRGLLTNDAEITARNGANTYTVAANQGTYVGSIFMDGTNGQVTCHRAFGQSRKWGLWNAYNRRPLYLKAGDSTSSWSYNTATIRASNNASANSLTVFSGLAEEIYDLRFEQNLALADNGITSEMIAQNGIGWNSTTAFSGKAGKISSERDQNSNGNILARFLQVPSLGVNVVTALELGAATGGTTISWQGGEDDMLLVAKWMG